MYAVWQDLNDNGRRCTVLDRIYWNILLRICEYIIMSAATNSSCFTAFVSAFSLDYCLPKNKATIADTLLEMWYRRVLNWLLLLPLLIVWGCWNVCRQNSQQGFCSICSTNIVWAVQQIVSYVGPFLFFPGNFCTFIFLYLRYLVPNLCKTCWVLFYFQTII